MQLADVSILVNGYRADLPGHQQCRELLLLMAAGPLPYAVNDHLLSGFVRVVTHPRILDPPAPIEDALAFAQVYRDQPNAVSITPGRRHWDIFTGLCASARPRGNLILDAYIAALAIESGCEWLSADRDFHRFPGLKWRLIDV